MIASVSEVLEAIACDGHQLGYCRYIPERVGDLGMSDIGGEHQHRITDIDPLLIPADKTAADKAVPQVVDARVRVTSPSLPSELCSETGEGMCDLPIVHWPSAVGHEERVGRRRGQPFIPNTGIGTEGFGVAAFMFGSRSKAMQRC
ncbi:hypothetical protein LMG27174_07163 [Paraburkholderia rhynchosiae]|uniref:Uncharacterized protein n=1 Tax=Paraburkholderia rhynchosiae TaxID=487049 RepID=A0A6J5CV27_9BURK|nr:hypothetical protein LMG27174_07163 [Paraburkholderia rhynchosiae]